MYGRAQALMEQQHRTDWPGLLRSLVKQCHPLHEEISGPIEGEYYWTAAQSEYATDVMFRRARGAGADLSRAGASRGDEFWSRAGAAVYGAAGRRG